MLIMEYVFHVIKSEALFDMGYKLQIHNQTKFVCPYPTPHSVSVFGTHCGSAQLAVRVVYYCQPMMWFGLALATKN